MWLWAPGSSYFHGSNRKLTQQLASTAGHWENVPSFPSSTSTFALSPAFCPSLLVSELENVLSWTSTTRLAATPPSEQNVFSQDILSCVQHPIFKVQIPLHLEPEAVPMPLNTPLSYPNQWEPAAFTRAPGEGSWAPLWNDILKVQDKHYFRPINQLTAGQFIHGTVMGLLRERKIALPSPKQGLEATERQRRPPIVKWQSMAIIDVLRQCALTCLVRMWALKSQNTRERELRKMMGSGLHQ